MLTVLRPWLALIGQRKRRLALGGALMATTILAGVGLLALSGWFITATALTGLLLASGAAATLDVFVPGGGIRFFALTRTVARYFERLYNHDTVLRLLADIRVLCFSRLSQQDWLQRRHQRSSDWLGRLTGDVDALDNLYLQTLAPTAIAFGLLALVGLVLTWLAPLVLAIVIPLALSVILLLSLTFRYSYRASSSRQDEQQALRSRAIELIRGMPELQAGGHWHAHAAILEQQGRGFVRLGTVSDRVLAWSQGALSLLCQLAVTATLVIGLLLWQRDALSGPVAVMLALGILGVTEALTPLPAAFARAGGMLGAARRLNIDLGFDGSQQAAPPPRPATVTPARPAPADVSARSVELTNVGYSVNGEPVIERLSWSVKPGEHLGIVGPSGVGKSTLADLITGRLVPDRGNIQVGGSDPGTDNGGPDPIAYLMQQPWIFNDSIRFNLGLGRPGASDDQLLAMLDAVCLGDQIRALPGGLDTLMGEAGTRFSGGERRRIALARTLLHPAPVLVLDEPFTGVDLGTIQEIRHRLRPWLQGRTCIAIGHQREALPDVDHVLELKPN